MLALGSKPCKYSDCIYYEEDCMASIYQEHEKCGRCLYAYVNKPKSFLEKLLEPKPFKQKDRFRDIGRCQREMF